jgi:hypothetical protein
MSFPTGPALAFQMTDSAERRWRANLSVLQVAIEQGMKPGDQAVVMHYREGDGDPVAHPLNAQQWSEIAQRLAEQGFEVPPAASAANNLRSDLASEARDKFELEESIVRTAAVYPKFNFAPLTLQDAKQLVGRFGIDVHESDQLQSMSALARIYRDEKPHRDLIIVRSNLCEVHKVIKILYELCHRLRDISRLNRLHGVGSQSIFNISIEDQFDSADDSAKRFALVGVLPTPAMAWSFRREILGGEFDKLAGLRNVRNAARDYIMRVSDLVGGDSWQDQTMIRRAWSHAELKTAADAALVNKAGKAIFDRMRGQQLSGLRGFDQAFRVVLGSLEETSQFRRRLLELVQSDRGIGPEQLPDSFKPRFEGDAVVRMLSVYDYVCRQFDTAEAIETGDRAMRHTSVWVLVERKLQIQDCSDLFARFVGLPREQLRKMNLADLLAPSRFYDAREAACLTSARSAAPGRRSVFLGLEFARHALESRTAVAHACFRAAPNNQALCVIRPAGISIRGLIDDDQEESPEAFQRALGDAELLGLHGSLGSSNN